LAEQQNIPSQVTNDFFNQVEEPQLASEAESQWLGGNLGTSGSSSFGADYLAQQQAQAAAQAGLYGQQYVTQELNNDSNAVSQLLNERQNYFGTNLALEQQQNQQAINEQMGLNALDLQGQTTNAQNQLATDQLNQGGAVSQAQLNQSALGQTNTYNLNAANDLNNFGLSSAQQLGSYNQTLMNAQLQASEATAANQTKLLSGITGLVGGAAGASGITSGLGSYGANSPLNLGGSISGLSSALLGGGFGY
jgi:hypothetical protein